MPVVLTLTSDENGLQTATTPPGSGCPPVSVLYHVLHLCLMPEYGASALSMIYSL